MRGVSLHNQVSLCEVLTRDNQIFSTPTTIRKSSHYSFVSFDQKTPLILRNEHFIGFIDFCESIELVLYMKN